VFPIAALSLPFLFVLIQNNVVSFFDNWGENRHSKSTSSPSLTSICSAASFWLNARPNKNKKKRIYCLFFYIQRRVFSCKKTSLKRSIKYLQLYKIYSGQFRYVINGCAIDLRAHIFCQFRKFASHLQDSTQIQIFQIFYETFSPDLSLSWKLSEWQQMF